MSFKPVEGKFCTVKSLYLKNKPTHKLQQRAQSLMQVQNVLLCNYTLNLTHMLSKSPRLLHFH